MTVSATNSRNYAAVPLVGMFLLVVIILLPLVAGSGV